MKTPKKNIAALAAAHAPSDELRHLKAEVARLSSALEKRKQDSGQISEAMAEVLAEVPVASVPKMLYRPPSRGRVSQPVVQVVHCSDWHIGEVVNPAHTEEFGAANYALAEARVTEFSRHIITSAQLSRHAHQIDRCHIIGTADWVSGDIHDELVRTNEFPAPVQAVRAGFLLGSFIAAKAAHFSEVVVDLLTAGNHDRITRKPQSADGGLNSWGYVVCEIARQHVSALPNVKVNVHTSLSTVINVGGVRYLISHGDGIKGTWGIPYYGIERRKQGEAMARMNMDPSRHFDKIVIGHFHSALNHEHWLIGGSLTGTTEFDHKCGRHSKPHQTSWLVHPRHKEFNWTRWWL